MKLPQGLRFSSCKLRPLESIVRSTCLQVWDSLLHSRPRCYAAFTADSKRGQRAIIRSSTFANRPPLPPPHRISHTS